MTSDASIAVAEPTFPSDIPTIALDSAGASLIPSPIIARPSFENLDTYVNLSSTERFAYT